MWPTPRNVIETVLNSRIPLYQGIDPIVASNFGKQAKKVYIFRV